MYLRVMNTLKELVDTSYSIALDHGWWDETRSFSTIVDLMHSELSEAIEDYRNGHSLTEIWLEKEGTKPCGIPTELADVMIRIADYCGSTHLDVEAEFSKWTHLYSVVGAAICRPSEGLDKASSFEKEIAKIHFALSMSWITGTGMEPLLTLCGGVFLDSRMWLMLAIHFTLQLCERNGIDIWAAIDQKTEYNRSRPYRHGGKVI